MTDQLSVRTVGIVGAGTIGASWAAFYAGRGMQVRLFDSDPRSCEQGLDRARRYVEDLRRFGLLALDAASGDLMPAESVEEVATGAGFIHEAVAERYDAKLPLFSRLDALAPPEVILASSSSGLLMTRIQEGMRHPERALVAHPFNPPHLIPLVELVPGARTAPHTVQRLYAFYAGLGKLPVVLRMEVPGHIANRLAAALWREALDLVARGVASVEDVDRALCAGPGLRWALMGQHLIYHLGGGQGGYQHFIEHIGRTWSALWIDMADWTEIPPEATDAAVAGIREVMADRDAAEVAAWRDEKLAALLKVVYG